MQANNVVERVLAHPKFQELTRRRGRTSLWFFLLMLVVYAGFILTLAYWPEVFARPIGPGYTMSVGVLTAIIVAVSAVVMISAFVHLSNKHYDPLIAAIVRDVK
ncbi:DUF485 domain-containing protein [Lysobacter sp. A03]|uniref:DUF485 domain-containing protein n=1 Tax=Lysobacter sp. A03 TaxID=1199154 RepID=UPI0005B6F856|nr:DUF485 domain-containing protein [Lysobacter sp. A03]KIQ97270.1 putative membrane protein, clustering with ActP [Lysobacter sp. A03]